MSWDKSVPAGSDSLSNGDDVLRTLKQDLETAFRADDTEGVEAIFPGAVPASPVFRYRGLKDTTANRPTAGQYGLFFDTTRNVLQRDNGTSWEDIAQLVTDGSITEAKLSSSVAGDGLSGGANTPLSVNVGAGLEISSDAVRIAAEVAGDGLSGGSGSALAVNVDNSTIEINSDSLRVKDGGITYAKIANSSVGGQLFKYESVSIADKTVKGQESTSVVINNAFPVGVKFSVTFGASDNASVSCSYLCSVSNGLTITPGSYITFSNNYNIGSSITFSSIVFYYISLPTPSY